VSYKYEMIADALRRRIEAGEFKDKPLPSTNELRQEFGVSYGSVRSAILILKAEKLVVGKQGEGVFAK
jgi:GntR family transcriptional regulator